MESMTGYAYIEGKTEQFSYSVSLRSLNSKYVEIFVNLPKILKNEEQEFFDLVKRSFDRGKIEFNIEIFDWVVSRTVAINDSLLKSYVSELEAVESVSVSGKTFSLDPLLALDGVVQRERSVINSASLLAIKKSSEKVLKDALAMREKEGRAIEKDILGSVSVIGSGLAEIKKSSKSVTADNFKKLKDKIVKLAGSGVDDQRIYTEIAILADKLDISEEIMRLTDHIKKFKETSKERGQIGRKLDFIAQEMFREINTIASKSNSSEIAHLTVEMKNCIDKIREQCRNIV